MKYLLFTALCLSVLAVGCCCRVEDEGRPLAGGFSAASVEDKEVVEAAEFAVGKIAESEEGGAGVRLGEIISAERQVVAGINYRLVLSVESGGKARIVDAIVWRKLSGDYELISWEGRK